MGSGPTEYPVQRGIASLKLIPAPDILESTLPEGYVCLITDDGTGLTTSLAGALTGLNWNVVVLSYSLGATFETDLISAVARTEVDKELNFNRKTSPVEAVAGLGERAGLHYVNLDGMDEDELQGKLAEITTSIGPIGAVIHLNPHQNPPMKAEFNTANVVTQTAPESFANQEKLIVRLVFMLAKHLKGTINESAQKGRGIFMSITHLDGQFGLSMQSDFDPISGGLFGLVKTLNLEWEPVFCRAVDLDPAFGIQESTDRILAELFDPNRLISEVGYSQRGRLTLVVEPVSGKKESK